MLSEIDGTVRYSSPQHKLTNITQNNQDSNPDNGGAGKTALPTHSCNHTPTVGRLMLGGYSNMRQVYQVKKHKSYTFG